jgi:PAS domain S-box-containing protein
LRLVDITLLIVSSLLGFFLAVFIARKRRGPGSQALSILILGASIWSLGYAFEIMASSIIYKLFWERLEFFGIVIIPLAWFTFVAQYLGYPGWMRNILKQKILLGIIPVVTLVLVWTNPLHRLMWQSVSVVPVGPLVALDFVRGPWFWVLMIYSYSLLLFASVKLGISLFSIVRLQRWQVSVTLLAILLPWVGNIIYISGWTPEHFFDWAAFLFLISGVLFLVSLFRFQLVNILPIAQEAVFAGLSDGVFVLDKSNGIVDMNPSARKLIQLTEKEALGKNISQVMPELVEAINKACDAGEYKDEFSLGNGPEQQYYDLHISRLADVNKNPIGCVIMLHQITQLKRDHAELVKARNELEGMVAERTEALWRAVDRLQQELTERSLAEKRFETVIESAPEAMFVLDQSGKILLTNGMAERLFGYLREELMGMDVATNLVPERHRQQQRKYFMEFLENPVMNPSSFGEDLYAMRKDGSEFPMEVDISRLDAADGFWVAVSIRDITARKQAEAALRESEKTYRALFENAGDAIFLTAPDGKIIQANQLAAELLGFDREELLNLSIFDITVSDELESVQQNMDQLVNGNRLSTYTRHYLKKSGEVLPTENNTVLVRDVDGHPKFFQNIARDISERIEAEQAQAQLLEEIRQSNEQLRDLAFRLQEVQEQERQELAAVLHDRVGQNLTGLNLNLKILQDQMHNGYAPEIKKRLDDSLTMVEETTHKIRDVMADLNPPVLEQYGLLAAIKWYCGDFSNRTGITVHVSGDKDERRLEPSVERILFRLVQEALMNVAKHAQAKRVTVSMVANKDAISVAIKDNGTGFDMEALKVPTKEPHWGLLSMQRKASSIGATLAIDSLPGMGTKVCIKIRRDHHAH